MINNGYEIDAEINADPLLYNIYQEIYSQNFGDVFSVFWRFLTEILGASEFKGAQFWTILRMSCQVVPDDAQYSMLSLVEVAANHWHKSLNKSVCEAMLSWQGFESENPHANSRRCTSFHSGLKDQSPKKKNDFQQLLSLWSSIWTG